MDTWSNTTWDWRHRWRLTQEEAARYVNVSLSTWRRWERGTTEPRVEEARRAMGWMLQFEKDWHRDEVAADVRAQLDYEREVAADE